MSKLVATIVLLLTQTFLLGQTFDTEFYPFTEADDVVTSYIIDTDEEIFSVPAWSAPDPFRNFSRYRFGAVRYRERGLDSHRFKVFLGGIDISDNLSSYPDWSLITLARRSGLAAEQVPAMVAGAFAAEVGRSDSYLLRAADEGFYASLRATDRYSRTGGDVRYSGSVRRGWSYALAATGQFGSDGHIKGLGTNELGGVGSLTKRWDEGVSLTVFVAGNVSERGIRLGTTREAFDLVGDNLYNPVWGMQDGRVRNSRMSRVRGLFAAASLEFPLSGGRTVSITAAFRHKRDGRTRLAWYNAASPIPDYYRSMPSFLADGSSEDKVEDLWRAGDPAVTQVDWAGLLYDNNTLEESVSANYIVEEQVEQAGDAHLNFDITRKLENGLDISYGVRLRRDRSRFFKVADDMLGAEWVPNVDQYVTDEDGETQLRHPTENDMRNPGRQVRQGDKFGYDYAVTRLRPSVFGVVRWNKGVYGITASGSVSYTGLQREGFYEKEIFPGTASLGKSARAEFTTFSLGGSVWWNPAARHSLGLSVLASSETPFARNIFLSPAQNNLMVAAPEPSGLYGAEISWALGGEDVDLRVTGFLSSTTGETQVRQYYDDLKHVFSEMEVRGIDRLSYGVEVGVEARLARWLTLTAGGSLGEYRYNSEPTATVFADETGEIVSEGIVCYMSGLHTGLPQVVAGAEIAYSDRHRWRVSLSGEWMGARHVEINPLYHSSRINGISPSPEIMGLFTSQERLPNAFTLGVSLSKGFVIGRGYLRIAANVRNVLSSSIIHSGYEQKRIRNVGTSNAPVLVPFEPKYLYSWPRTWSITISYRL